MENLDISTLDILNIDLEVLEIDIDVNVLDDIILISQWYYRKMWELKRKNKKYK